MTEQTANHPFPATFRKCPVCGAWGTTQASIDRHILRCTRDPRHIAIADDAKRRLMELKRAGQR